MIAIQIDVRQLTRLRKAVGSVNKNMGREIAAAINATAKKTRLNIGRDVRETINVKKADSEAPLKIQAKATAQSPQTTVSIQRTRRPSLRKFGGRQDKKGVSYKIDKKGGRKRVNGAFVWQAIDRVFIRRGEERLPIIELKGVSVYGAYAKNDFTPREIKRINAELSKQVERRINLNILRANGLVKT